MRRSAIRWGGLAGLLGIAGLIALAAGPLLARDPDQGVPAVTLPNGFTMSVFASGVQTARFLTYSPQGDLYVGQLLGDSSAITILPDRDHNNSADRAVRVAGDLYSPNNVTFRPIGFGTVFASGAYGQVKIYTDTQGDLSYAHSAVLVPGLPADGRHKTKTVAYGPDGQLYVSMGSVVDDPTGADARAGIWRYNADGSGGHRIIGGLRNTEGFGWDAVTGALWGADNGSDDQGANVPHDELNLLTEGTDYGWPYCIDNRVHVAQNNAYDCSKTQAPAVLLAAHAGALGTAFYTGGTFPAHYWGGVFIAYHTTQYPARRGVYFIPFQNGQPSGPPELFAGGSNRWMGLAINPYDGSLMISDDGEGRIFQVRYTGTPPAAPAAAPRPTAVAGKPQPVTAPALPGFSRPFAATHHTLHGAFLQFWFWNGGLARYGYPISDPLTEQGAEGKPYLVQYTERARLEYHPENRGGPYEVLLGLLGTDLAAGRTDPPFRAAAAVPGATYVSETLHNLSGPIAAYWQRNGGVPVFGYPLSEAFTERNPSDGKSYLVQYFERARLEYHPEYQGTDSEILLGLLGVQSYAARYGGP